MPTAAMLLLTCYCYSVAATRLLRALGGVAERGLVEGECRHTVLGAPWGGQWRGTVGSPFPELPKDSPRPWLSLPHRE